MNFILFNGPPRSGKDTAAKVVFSHILYEHSKFVPVWEKFSFPLKRTFAGIMNIYCDTYGNVEYYEQYKEETVRPFDVSYRQFQIDLSEKFLKPVYGENIFGRLLLQRCHDRTDLNDTSPIFIVSDCGFQIECDILRGHNVLLIRMDRDGCDFSDDSREYVGGYGGWKIMSFVNNGPLDSIGPALLRPIDEWIATL